MLLPSKTLVVRSSLARHVHVQCVLIYKRTPRDLVYGCGLHTVHSEYTTGLRTAPGRSP